MEDERKDKSSDAPDDMLTLARKRYEAGYQREQDNIIAAYEDMKFRAGEQWDTYAKEARAGRPMLTIDHTSPFVRQVANDIRQMRPAVNVVAVADGATKETAEVIGGMFRYIENRSEAQAAYYRAADFQIAAGMGAIRVGIQYASAASFDQEIAILPVMDPIAIVWDPDAILPTREDAGFCFVPFDISHDAFKERFPGKSFEPFDFSGGLESTWAGWHRDDSIRIAEYWFKQPDTVKLALLANGKTIELDEGTEESALDDSIVRIEERPTHKVMRAVISAGEVLEEPEEWPGRYIPIVPVIGEEIGVETNTVRRGIVRPLKDAQRSLNYHASAQVEAIALQPKAPFIGTEMNFRSHQSVWQQANTKNYPFLPYTPDPQTNGQPPQRSQPPVASQGIAEARATAAEDMQAISGIYPAALGARSNETSGKAINARAREADTGTYHFVDNFARAIRYLARVVVDLIPEVYDAERVIHIVEPDGSSKTVSINQPQGVQAMGDGFDDAQGIGDMLNDVTAGVYDVVLQSGPAYSTKREQAREGMMQLMQSMPDAAVAIVDLIAKAQEWPDAQEVAERLETMLPPAIQAKLKEKRGEPPEPPPPPPPEAQAAMAQAQAAMAKAEADKAKAEADMMKAQVEAARAQMEAQAMLNPPPVAMPIEPAQPPAPDPMETMGHDVLKARAMKELDFEFEQRRRRMDRNTAQAAEMGMGEDAAIPEQPMGPTPVEVLAQAITAQGQAFERGLMALAESMQAMSMAHTAPKRIMRDERGRVVGAETVLNG